MSAPTRGKASRVIDVFVTNLGKYNEGDICGEWLKLPATTEELQAVFARIGVDGVLYEEWFITDYESDISGLARCLSDYASIDELNYLAATLDELDEREVATFEAAVEYGEYTSTVKDLINLAQNLDCYNFYPDIENEEDLGYLFADEFQSIEIPDEIQPYFNYEAYGRNISIEGGKFVGGGYVEADNSMFTEYYDGKNIPEEYRIVAHPKIEEMSIKAQMAMYSRIVDVSDTGGKHRDNREDR